MGRDHPARPVAAQSPLCKAPLPLKIRAAQGCPLGVGTARNRTTRVSPAQSHGLGVPSCPQAPTSVQFQGGKTNGEVWNIARRCHRGGCSHGSPSLEPLRCGPPCSRARATSLGDPGRGGRWELGASRWIPATLRSKFEFIFAFSHSVSQTFQPRLPKCLSSDF